MTMGSGEERLQRAQYTAPPLTFLESPISKCLQRLMASRWRNLHVVHSRRRTIFLVVLACTWSRGKGRRCQYVKGGKRGEARPRARHEPPKDVAAPPPPPRGSVGSAQYFLEVKVQSTVTPEESWFCRSPMYRQGSRPATATAAEKGAAGHWGCARARARARLPTIPSCGKRASSGRRIRTASGHNGACPARTGKPCRSCTG